MLWLPPCGAPKIAKLVNITAISLWSMVSEWLYLDGICLNQLITFGGPTLYQIMLAHSHIIDTKPLGLHLPYTYVGKAINIVTLWGMLEFPKGGDFLVRENHRLWASSTCGFPIGKIVQIQRIQVIASLKNKLWFKITMVHGKTHDLSTAIPIITREYWSWYQAPVSRGLYGSTLTQVAGSGLCRKNTTITRWLYKPTTITTEGVKVSYLGRMDGQW